MNTKKQIPNMLVYGVLYAVIFGISIWLLVFDNESPTNWVLYAGLGVAVVAALIKFAVHKSAKRTEYL